ncbi:N-acetylmuramoyl-L-alanine amidase [Nocardioides cavernaquae]|uniref:N-acetylmuramoyl-L-alanine amidase n=1 Tax=Nocardioides cavernaquae TaxID=2321396 RepID=A0A3A5HBE2_9ACTN|nr:N-acetylmuramoyl-L-alanine amidase [Nocardioides cavernaquae]
MQTLGDTGPVRPLGTLAAAAAGTTLALSTSLLVAPPSNAPGTLTRVAATSTPLAGRTIVLDPGHQLGNRNFPREIARLVPAGGMTKPCNTTGTSTNGGYPEATMAMSVSRLLKRRLEALGARVVMTRYANREDRWGPCVDVRGRAGNASSGVRADLKLSVHGDGNIGGGPGFHVIAPTSRAGWTDDIAASSLVLAKRVRLALLAAGLPVAAYTGGGDGLDLRGDLGTLNLSDVPAAMVELGNMRSRADAARMTTLSGRTRYARALAAGIVSYLR